ncbi:P-loop containing nucleoside triphosphate hydrolase protein [Staphylotrichum tortipilum]|uniref:P-loop containing nucleoside triphosphate hydrolase protein n=1 Tax=Staphylotrichum tortipilum TaxID=2831512 RepID=A0AAN6RS66_9PEZI|nr:P-loop containing nucleoside triphosphate hydrolase protein [Staphylotrichum longicolle]
MARGETLIAIIGVTGAGKTTFVQRATGRTDLQVGHGIDSCTQDVIPISYTLPDGRRVTLIDTPGFDDSERSDADILGLVAAYMAQTYKQGVLLNGILFLQPINQPRLQGSEVRRTRLFKKLLGENAYRRVIIATTMWSKVSESEAIERQRQRAARHDIWGDMVSRGATVERHDDTAASAARIVQKLVQFSTPVTLQFQRELEATGGRVALTSAGRQLDADLGVVITKLRGELEELRRESAGAAAQAADEIRELRQKIARYEKERNDLDNTGWKELAAIFVSSVGQALPFVVASTCTIL